MKAEEIELIQSKKNAAIVAPAGHGKTEMITELVEKLPGKKLVLTHTNAGVSVLKQRINKKRISQDRYCLLTISSFCMKWCGSYPVTARIDPRVRISDKPFFNAQYCGTEQIFTHSWARSVLAKTYSCVIVDEYQDCMVEQHRIFVEINRTVPVYVLGDPLQSIFGWAGKPVSWNNLPFERVFVETMPHRWEKTNADLGAYLTAVRETLMPALEGKKVRLSTVPNGSFIKRIPPSATLGIELIREMNQYESALYLTKWPRAQCAFSKQTGGIFQNDEPQNMAELYDYAQRLDTEDGSIKAKAVFSFIEECATRINAELGSYKKHINNGDHNFTQIKKHPEFGERMLRLYENNCYDDILSVLNWIKFHSLFKVCRKELFNELIRSVRHARDKGITIYEAAQQIRTVSIYHSQYAGFKKLSSRVVLSKGLEFECVVIDLKERYTVTEMYVAMTRAMRTIYFITDKDSILLDTPQ